MNRVPLTKDLYPEWDRFCAQSDDAWFWHTTRWLEYTLQYRPDFQPESKSFLVMDGSHILAVCPLVREQRPAKQARIAEFSFGGGAGPLPAFANELSEAGRGKLFRTVLEHVDQLARAEGVQRVAMRFTPVAPSFLKHGLPPANTLLRYDFIDVSLATQILDLTADLPSLLRAMRKGHRYDIKRGEKLLQGRVLGKETITREMFAEYQRMHQKAAGRLTRPMQTFEMMYDWICAGWAILSCASRDGVPIGFALISVYKDGAYYSSGCEDPDGDLPIGHVLQWTAIQWLKAHGIRYYEIGWQQYGNLL